MELADLERRVKMLETALQMLVLPSMQSETTTEAGTATAMMEHVAGSRSVDVPLIQQYGFWSRPLQGSMHTVLNVGGRMGRPISIAQNDERYRPKSLGIGDVVVQDNSGQKVLLSSGTTITMTANSTVLINAPTTVTITSPLVTMTGNLHVQQNLSVDGTMNITGTGGGGHTATITGNIAVTGGITTTNDVVAGSISLQTHHHGGVVAGGANTSGPT